MFTFKRIGESHHFVITSDEPVRIEVVGVENGVIAFGYKGTEVDLEQEPDLVFDSTIK